MQSHDEKRKRDRDEARVSHTDDQITGTRPKRLCADQGPEAHDAKERAPPPPPPPLTKKKRGADALGSEDDAAGTPPKRLCADQEP